MRHIWRFCAKSGASHSFTLRSMTITILVHIGLYLPKLCSFTVFEHFCPCWDSNPRPLESGKLPITDSAATLYSYGYSNFVPWLTMCMQCGRMLYRIVKYGGTRGNLTRSGTCHVTDGTKLFAPRDSHACPLPWCKRLSSPVLSFACWGRINFANMHILAIFHSG